MSKNIFTRLRSLFSARPAAAAPAHAAPAVPAKPVMVTLFTDGVISRGRQLSPEYLEPRLTVSPCSHIWRELGLNRMVQRQLLIAALNNPQHPGGEQIVHRLFADIYKTADHAALDPRAKQCFFIIAESAELIATALASEAFRDTLAQAEQQCTQLVEPGSEPAEPTNIHIWLCYPSKWEPIERGQCGQQHHTAHTEQAEVHIFTPQQLMKVFQSGEHATSIADPAPANKQK